MKKWLFFFTLFMMLLSVREVLAKKKFPINVMKNAKFKNVEQSQFLGGGKLSIVVLFRSWCPASNLQIDELIELRSKLRKRNQFKLILIGIDRKYGFKDSTDFKVNEKGIINFLKKKKLKPEHVFLGDRSLIKDLKALPSLSRVELTPVLIFIDRSREVYVVRKGFHKGVVIEEVLNKMNE